MAEVVSKRIFIGGLSETITADELAERFSRFGKVDNVSLKTRKGENGEALKSFAHLDLLGDEGSFKKCFNTYQNAKWKGSAMKLQYAKESFLEKLQREREQQKSVALSTTEVTLAAPTELVTTAKGVPGTPVPGKKEWVVGKYGRALPVMKLKKSYKVPVVKHDPSKFCHAAREFKEEGDNSGDKPCTNLTWEINQPDSEMTKKRKGDFPPSASKPKKKATTTPTAQASSISGSDPKANLKSSLFDRFSNEGPAFRSDSVEVVRLGAPLGNKPKSANTPVSNKFDSDVESEPECAPPASKIKKQTSAIGTSLGSKPKTAAPPVSNKFDSDVESEPESSPPASKTKKQSCVVVTGVNKSIGGNNKEKKSFQPASEQNLSNGFKRPGGVPEFRGLSMLTDFSASTSSLKSGQTETKITQAQPVKPSKYIQQSDISPSKPCKPVKKNLTPDATPEKKLTPSEPCKSTAIQSETRSAKATKSDQYASLTVNEPSKTLISVSPKSLVESPQKTDYETDKFRIMPEFKGLSMLSDFNNAKNKSLATSKALQQNIYKSTLPSTVSRDKNNINIESKTPVHKSPTSNVSQDKTTKEVSPDVTETKSKNTPNKKDKTPKSSKEKAASKTVTHTPKSEDANGYTSDSSAAADEIILRHKSKNMDAVSPSKSQQSYSVQKPVKTQTGAIGTSLGNKAKNAATPVSNKFDSDIESGSECSPPACKPQQSLSTQKPVKAQTAVQKSVLDKTSLISEFESGVPEDYGVIAAPTSVSYASDGGDSYDSDLDSNDFALVAKKLRQLEYQKKLNGGKEMKSVKQKKNVLARPLESKAFPQAEQDSKSSRFGDGRSLTVDQVSQTKVSQSSSESGITGLQSRLISLAGAEQTKSAMSGPVKGAQQHTSKFGSVKEVQQNISKSETVNKVQQYTAKTETIKETPQYKQLSEREKRQIANTKRLEAMKEQARQREQQLQIMKDALKNVDAPGSNTNRTVFESSSEDEGGDGHDNGVSSAKDVGKSKSSITITSESNTSLNETNSSTSKSDKSCDVDSTFKPHKKVLSKDEQTGSIDKIKTKSGPTLFDSSSDDSGSEEEDYDEMFKSKPQFEGKKGEKLLKLEKSFGDQRFKLDAKFADTDSEDEKEEEETKTPQVDGDETENKDKDLSVSLKEEKSASIKVLENIVGKSTLDKFTDKINRNTKKMIDMNSVRFDPTKMKPQAATVTEEAPLAKKTTKLSKELSSTKATREAKRKLAENEESSAEPKKKTVKFDSDSESSDDDSDEESNKEKIADESGKESKDSKGEKRKKDPKLADSEAKQSRAEVSNTLVDLFKSKDDTESDKTGTASFSLTQQFGGGDSDSEEEETNTGGLFNFEKDAPKPDEVKKTKTDIMDKTTKKTFDAGTESSKPIRAVEPESDDESVDESSDEEEKTEDVETETSPQSRITSTNEDGIDPELINAGRMDIRFTKEAWLEQWVTLRASMIKIYKKKHKDALKKKRLQGEIKRKKDFLKNSRKGVKKPWGGFKKR